MNKLMPYLLAIAVLSALALWLRGTDNTGELSNDWQSVFAIEDSAKIDRIRIADVQGRVADLRRSNEHHLGLWRINNAFFARKDATDLLLKTAVRTMVKQPVTPQAEPGVLKMIATAGKRVDFFERGIQKPVKTWFIGTPTQSHTGTNMLLEVPDHGRATSPFVTHMEGFTGFLSTRFFTDELDWRYTGIYNKPVSEITAITAIPQQDIGQAARIVLPEEGGKPWVESLSGEPLDALSEHTETLLRRFEKVHVETWMSHLTSAGEDSLRASTPAWSITVDYRGGESRSIDLFWKPKNQEIPDGTGAILPFDGSRMYAVYNGEVALIQTFVFDPILKFWRVQLGFNTSGLNGSLSTNKNTP
jgi:hypothetical protein